jgi:hypothetical protein
MNAIHWSSNRKLSEWDDIIVVVGLVVLILILFIGSDAIDTIFFASW